MRRLLRSLGPYVRAHRRTFLLGLAFLLVSNVFGTIGPRFLQQGIDALAAHAGRRAVARAIGLMLAVGAVGGLARFGMRQCLNSGSRRVEADLRQALFAHLQTLSQPFFDRFTTGDLMARLTNDLLALRMVAGPALMYLVDTAVRALLIIPAMVAISPALTGLALLPLAGLPLVMVRMGNRIHYRSLAIQQQFSELTRQVHEHLSGVRVVRAYRQEAAEIRRFGALNADYAARNLALARVQGAFHPLLQFLGGLGTVAVLALGGRLVVAGTVTVGAFIAFGVYLAMLVWPMIALGWAINLLQRGAASVGRIDELLAARPEVVPPASPRPLPPAGAGRALRVEGVWFRYPGAEARGWVLQGVSFEVPAGGSVAIVGATGSGKSTLAELLVRTYDPDRGRILLDGVDLRALAAADLRAAVGFVPQETFLFSETLRENVLLGAPDDGRLERVAAVSQLAAALPELPQGADTLLGERGINLSGGQKQRAAIARALAQDPPVLVLDDCLSAVDAQTEMRILRGLRDALRGRTSIVISHRLAAVRDADLILVLEGGRVVERGRHEELVARDGRYWALLRRQQLEAEIEATTAGTSGTPA